MAFAHRGLSALVVFAWLAAFGAASVPALAQDKFPSHPITMIIPFPPGGVADQTGRPVAAGMEKFLKQPVIASNKGGAGGAVGMAAAANAKPDGYTILMALSSISIIPEADKLFDRKPAYEMKQLAPIALVTSDPTILVVPADKPWKTVADLVADAKKRPGEISFSSSGLYGTLHMATEMFAHAAGVKFRHVPFAGAGPAMTALLGGHVDMLASGPGVVVPHIKAGKLRALAGWGEKRVAALPDVPTFKELGYKDVEFYIWAGVFAPAATPAPVQQVLRDAVRAAVNDPEFKATMEKLQTPVSYLDAPEFKKFWDKDAAMLAAAVKRVGRVEEKK
ncbi:MAG: tripartite tricarboxylate transporter substrate binding protein [Alphaproteobacteria bacterium]|nr:tripartite tricarboxylate transporter substrate binding protein [Alphaproteobacteria bacterium]MBM3952682.1 tripartite tricarboxylate transporter substrate binding protein [Rhodospirillales bacterium]